MIFIYIEQFSKKYEKNQNKELRDNQIQLLDVHLEHIHSECLSYLQSIYVDNYQWEYGSNYPVYDEQVKQYYSLNFIFLLRCQCAAGKVTNGCYVYTQWVWAE
jgi:hypothetical protein